MTHVPQTARPGRTIAAPSRFQRRSSSSLACLNSPCGSDFQILWRLCLMSSWTTNSDWRVDSCGCCSSAWQNSSRPAPAAQPPSRRLSALDHLSGEKCGIEGNGVRSPGSRAHPNKTEFRVNAGLINTVNSSFSLSITPNLHRISAQLIRKE